MRPKTSAKSIIELLESEAASFDAGDLEFLISAFLPPTLALYSIFTVPYNNNCAYLIFVFLLLISMYRTCKDKYRKEKPKKGFFQHLGK